MGDRDRIDYQLVTMNFKWQKQRFIRKEVEKSSYSNIFACPPVLPGDL